MSALFESVSEGRKHFKDLLDAAEQGLPAGVRRDIHWLSIVDGERFRILLGRTHMSGAQVVPEAGGWSVFLPGLPVSADGATLDEAMAEMVDALREYADDWADHLRHAPNHADNWALTQLITLSTNEQLRDWLVGA